uniref:(northern house mosquito) hypothetical protein n=1 Tax=Culex pipiens TaxID=7175 RepID=A0A8D8CRS3_CULPI
MLKHIHSGPVSGQNRSARGLNRVSQPLNVSTVSNTSVTPSSTKHMNGGPPRLLSSFITPLPSVSSNSNNNHHNATNNNNNSTTNNNILSSTTVNINKDRLGAREALTSLGLLCLEETNICKNQVSVECVQLVDFSFLFQFFLQE